MPHSSLGHMLDAVARAPKPPIETAEQAIQELGDSLACIMDQLVKGKWKDELDHDVCANVSMTNAAATMRRVMEFRTRVMGYTDVSDILAGDDKEQSA